MASLGPLKGIFYVEGTVIDDRVFKLHYGFTTLALVFMAAMAVGKLLIVLQTSNLNILLKARCLSAIPFTAP